MRKAGDPQQPWLTIAVPYYDGPEYLSQSLKSLAAQSSPGWRAVVLDDRGPDVGAREVVADAVPDDERFTVIVNEANRGVAGNFNRAIDVAAGVGSHSMRTPWVQIMGADDMVLPGFVTAVDALRSRHTHVDVVQPAVQVIDGEAQPTDPLADRIKRLIAPRHESVCSGQNWAASLMVGNWHYFPSLVWRTAVLSNYRFDESLTTVMDLDILLRLIDAGSSCAVGTDPVFAYRRHAGSVSSLTAADGERFAEERAVYRAWGDRFQHRGWHLAALAARVHPTSRLHALLSVVAARRAG